MLDKEMDTADVQIWRNNESVMERQSSRLGPE